ncbi:PQ-loop repeat family protein / transmembrane family protein [Perilla frutescens var. hirtella]|nr:PQ-loop repeat family protein / transmembrane family protein [Perilla frutescens var. frutescens]KAH6787569.1 PQ-loop repeat family protein / transmembrane family protein [Perilla frutescens var. hirtella]
MSPPQTFNKSYPFVYTQCQAIHARSIFSCQDTPAARIKFTVKLNIPRYLSAVMAAKHLDRRDPIAGECHGACDDSLCSRFFTTFWDGLLLPLGPSASTLNVVGLNFDFVVLNLTKHSSYLIYNASLFFSSTVQRQYREKFGLDEMIPVAANDVAFYAHAVLLTIFTLFQIVIYDVVSLLV